MAKGGGPIVDFTGVQSGGGRPRIPEGDHLAKVASVKQETSSKGNEMLVWRFEVSNGRGRGKVLQTYTSLNTEALWKLRGLLEALGVAVPDGRAQLRLKNYIGKEIGITVIDEEYNNRIYSNITDFISADSLTDEDVDDEEEDEEEEEEDEEEEATPPPKAKKSKKAKRREAEEEEEIEDIDLDEL